MASISSSQRTETTSIENRRTHATGPFIGGKDATTRQDLLVGRGFGDQTAIDMLDRCQQLYVELVGEPPHREGRD